MAADRAEKGKKKTIGISKQTDERVAGSDKATLGPGQNSCRPTQFISY